MGIQMKCALKTASVAALIFATSLAAMPAAANNKGVDIAFQSLGDTSMFYQGLVNTGLVAAMRDDEHYTIFAPTNASLMETPPQVYPCFYSVECRPQVAEILRDHIIVGRYDLKDLVRYGSGINTAGPRMARIEEPYVGNYTIDGRTILSKIEVDGNIIYRVDGLLADRQDLSRFQTASYVPPAAITTTQVTTYGSADGLPEEITRTTTVTHESTIEP